MKKTQTNLFFVTLTLLITLAFSNGVNAQTFTYPADGDSLYMCVYPDTVKIRWTAGSAPYTLIVRRGATGLGPTLFSSSVYGTDTTVSGIRLGNDTSATYTIVLRQGSTQALLDSQKFYARPERIYLVKPINGAIGQVSYPTLTWFPTCLVGTTTYTLTYADNPSFTSPTTVTTVDPSVTLSSLTFATTYYWKVLATIDTGASDVYAYSDTYNFKVGTFWNNAGAVAGGHIIWDIADDGTYLYAGTWGGGIYRSPSSGDLWARVDTNLRVSFVWSLGVSNTGDTLFAATELGLFRSIDDGVSWTSVPLTIGGTYREVRSVAVDPNNSANMLAAVYGSGVYKSTDKGATWTAFNNGLTINAIPYLNVLALAIDTSGTKYYAGDATGGVFKLTTPSTTWSHLPQMPYGYVWALEPGRVGAFTPGTRSSASHIYAGTYGGGFYRSTNNGTAWFTGNTGLPSKWINSVYVDKVGYVYAGNWPGGVSRSDDGGATWNNLGLTQFPGADSPESDVSVSAIIRNNEGSLIVGTNDGRFYRTINHIATGVSNPGNQISGIIPDNFEVSQNYPNPFNPSTTIRYAVPEASNVVLKIYNMLGQEVVTLVNQEVNAGTYTVTWNGENNFGQKVSSGTYIYRVTAGKQSVSKKMILLK